MSSTATFGAGCFWGTEKFFKKQFKGVIQGRVGYMGGGGDSNPGYKQVCSGTTGHAEVYHVQFDPSKVQYADLVLFFFRMHNPTTPNRQGNDQGTQYRSAIFYHSEEQKQEALGVIEMLNGKTAGSAADKSVQLASEFSKAFGGKPISTTVEPAAKFWDAEDYHQNYLDINPTGYCNHRTYW